jgi:1,4-alpha-glucan branching enzyme
MGLMVGRTRARLDYYKADRFAGIRCIYRDLIRLRRNWYDNTRGLRGHQVNVHQVNDRDKVMAFHRWDRGGPRDDVAVVLNLGNRAYDAYRVGLPRGGQWQVRFNGDWRGYSQLFTDHPSYNFWAQPGGNNDAIPFGGDVGLGPTRQSSCHRTPDRAEDFRGHGSLS